MKYLFIAVALLAAADMTLRQGQGMHAVMRGVAGVGHAIGGWVYYQG